jgi:hypothetical protein
MGILNRLVLMGVAVVLLGGVSTAREREGRGEEPLYDKLLRECKLTEAQQADAKEKIKALDEALAAWDKDNAAKMEAAQAAAKEARSKADDDAKKKAAADLKALAAAREESGAQALKAVMALLTDEQKQAWGVYELYQSTIPRYRKASLTEDQLAKVRAACAVARAEIAEVGEDSKAGKETLNRLRWGIDVFVLTPEQREVIRPVKAKAK